MGRRNRLRTFGTQEDLNVGAAGGAILEHGTWTIPVSNWVIDVINGDIYIYNIYGDMICDM